MVGNFILLVSPRVPHLLIWYLVQLIQNVAEQIIIWLWKYVLQRAILRYRQNIVMQVTQMHEYMFFYLAISKQKCVTQSLIRFQVFFSHIRIMRTHMHNRPFFFAHTYERIRQWSVTDIGDWPLVNESSHICLTSRKWSVAESNIADNF